MTSSSVTRDGSRWMPEYLNSINPAMCIGCGRCFKVCLREVMHPHGIDEAGDMLGVCDGEDDFNGELSRVIMVIDYPGRCIGCGACARVCPKNCQTHIAVDHRPVHES